MKKVLIVLLLTPTLVTARPINSDSSLSVSSRYSIVTDVQTGNSSTAPVEFADSYEIEMGIRLRSFFSLMLAGFQSTDSTKNGYGGGIRIDMPGFFFIGGSRTAGRFARRNHPVNTSLFGSVMSVSNINEVGDTGTDVGTNMGVSMDVYPFNQYVYMTVQASMLNVWGNAFSVVSYGLGAEF